MRQKGSLDLTTVSNGDGVRDQTLEQWGGGGALEKEGLFKVLSPDVITMASAKEISKQRKL